MDQAVDEAAHEAANAEDDEDALERRVLIEAKMLRLYAKRRAEAHVDGEIAWERAELVAARAAHVALAAAAQDARDAAAGEDAADAAAGEDAADAAAAERLAVIAQRIADQPSPRQVAENFQCQQRIEARAYAIMEERRRERAVDDAHARFHAQRRRERAVDEADARFHAQMETARHDSCISAASLLIRHSHHDPNGVEAELIQEAVRTADAAKEEAIAAQVDTDAAFAAQLAADDVGAAESENPLV